MSTASHFNHKQSRFGKGEVWALISAVAYAADNLFASHAVTGNGLDAVMGVVLRSIPVMTFAIIMSFFAKKRNPECVSIFSSWKYLAAILAHGLLTFVIGNTLLFTAFKYGGVLVTTPLLGTNVLWSAIIAAVLLHEILNKRMLTGILVSIAGVFMLRIGQNSNVALPETWLNAVPLALITAFCWAAAGVLITYAMRNKIDRFQALAVSLVASQIVLNIYLAVTGKISLYWTAPRSLILSVLAAGLFNTVALVSITTAMQYTSVASAGTVSSLQVAFAPALAWIFLGEKMNLLYVLSIALILFGVILTQRAKSGSKVEKTPAEKESTTT